MKSKINKDQVTQLTLVPEEIDNEYHYLPAGKSRFLWMTLEKWQEGWHANFRRSLITPEDIERAGKKVIGHYDVNSKKQLELVNKSTLYLEKSSGKTEKIYFDSDDEMEAFVRNEFNTYKWITIKNNKQLC